MMAKYYKISGIDENKALKDKHNVYIPFWILNWMLKDPYEDGRKSKIALLLIEFEQSDDIDEINICKYISKQLGIGKSFVRETLDELENEGYIKKINDY